MKVDSSNRTLSVTATETVSGSEPDLAIPHTLVSTHRLKDAKAAYADGARASNAIIAAGFKQAGIPETSIRSEPQYLDRD